jgi:NDP-sugar pyrophosphorylase family protein
MLLYGDNYWPIPLGEMTANYEKLGLPVTTTVFSNKNGTGEYGYENNVIVDGSGRVTVYDKSRHMAGLNGIDIGYFIVEKSVLDTVEADNFSFEERVLARLAASGRLGAFVTDEQYYFITSLQDLRGFEAVALSKQFRRLERKGTG